MNCPLCQTPMEARFQHVVLQHHTATYRQCPACGFLQAADPVWLPEAYASSYTHQDTGIVSRCLQNRLKTEVVLHTLFKGEGTFLDIGGGIGLFTRMMRDIGFDFRTQDKYAEPILARGLEASDDLPATALTAFEVLEHIEDPLAFLREQLAAHACQTVLLSTTPFEGAPPPPEEWAYYGFEHGQHISFFTTHSMQALAKALGLVYTPVLRDLHLFTPAPVSAWQRCIFQARGLFLLELLRVKCVRRGRSFTQSDVR